MKNYIGIIAAFLVSYSATSQTVTVYLTTSGGSYSTEKWSNITTGINGSGTVVWSQGGGTIGTSAGTLTNEAISLTCGNTYYLNSFDRYDDGWDGTTYILQEDSGSGLVTLISNGGASPDDGSDSDATSTWGVGEYTVDIEASEAFTPTCPNYPDLNTATSACSGGTFDVTLTINNAFIGGAGGTVTISDGGTNPNQVVNTFPTTVTFTGYAAGSSVTLNADNGTGNINANTVSESCLVGYSCASAISITDGYTESGITSPGTGGDEDWVTSATASCGDASDAGFENSDVRIYSYTTGGTAGESFYFTIDHDASVDGEHSIGVFTSCAGGVLSGCLESTYKFDDVVGVCAQGLAANTTYYIAVAKEWYSLDGTDLDFDIIDFTVETSTTLPDDECATAPNIDISQPYSGSTRCTYTASASSPSGCGSIENDSWITFVAGQSEVEIDYDVSNCTNGNGVQLSAFSGNCSGLTLLPGSCINYASNNSTGTWNFSGLTPGATYYIRADGYAGDLCSYAYTPISGILPINLISFTGEALGNGFNKLKWTTASEFNNNFFELEKLNSQEVFEKISEIDGAGNSSQMNSYFSLDRATSNISYYRLKQIDFNGEFTYSDVISVSNNGTNVEIYPNPTLNGTIHLNNIEAVKNISILDNSGKLIQTFNNDKSQYQKIELGHLQSGMYFVLLVYENHTDTKKITLK